jgi:hypothetical protein
MARQSHMCYYYFQSLGRFIEDLATAELLADMQTQRLIPLVVDDLHRRSALGPEAAVTVQLGLAGLSALAEAEDFQTDWQAHFELPEDLRQFVALDAVVQEHVARTPDLRRELRPLTDLLNRAKRAAK